MNQNMPYFGLHSPTKLVALARSRMHVNLIDIETGTIEAYFKAGEDRFLNSLLVSGNGRYFFSELLHSVYVGPMLPLHTTSLLLPVSGLLCFLY